MIGWDESQSGSRDVIGWDASQSGSGNVIGWDASQSGSGYAIDLDASQYGSCDVIGWDASRSGSDDVIAGEMPANIILVTWLVVMPANLVVKCIYQSHYILSLAKLYKGELLWQHLRRNIKMT